ncbi:MAG: diiron oxygenase [Polyangiaceae bacterium]|nr:diiron oxygenase [Polyangiaceae bacterium]
MERPDTRRRWEALGWGVPIPTTRTALPERHYLDLSPLGMHEEQRARLNRAFTCFTCELFIHFEGYVIAYLERYPGKIRGLSRPMVQRFIHEEQIHSEMFRKLLHHLDPVRYPEEQALLRYLRWEATDDLALRVAPVGAFFLLAWLFEEITLFVPQVIDEARESCDPLVVGVMRLHAREELPHVALDGLVLAHLVREIPRWQAAMHTALALPLLAYVDRKVRGAWKRLVDEESSRLGLTERQRKGLLHRGPSWSDRLGMASFTEKLQESELPGAKLVGWVLRQELRRHG